MTPCSSTQRWAGRRRRPGSDPRRPRQPQASLSSWFLGGAGCALLGPRPLKPPLRELRFSLKLAEAPVAGQPWTVGLCPVEPVALAGVSCIGLELDQAATRFPGRISDHDVKLAFRVGALLVRATARG